MGASWGRLHLSRHSTPAAESPGATSTLIRLLNESRSRPAHSFSFIEDGDQQEMLSPLLAVFVTYGVVLIMVGCQTGLVMWRKQHQRSYELVTLVGLWLVPGIISVHLRFAWFFAAWVLFTFITLHLLSLCLVKKLHSSTPRKVYTFFLAVYRMSTAVATVGYSLVIAEIIGVYFILPHLRLMPRDVAIDLLWYGLYFGILGRDCAEVAADRMAASHSAVGAGGGRTSTSSVTSCGVCGNVVHDASHAAEHEERVVQLPCKHRVHDLCLRGWTMMGKKHRCPVCNEKVDLRTVFADRPWQTRSLTWIRMLDGVRYLVVWNPLVFLLLSVVFHVLSPDSPRMQAWSLQANATTATTLLLHHAA